MVKWVTNTHLIFRIQIQIRSGPETLTKSFFFFTLLHYHSPPSSTPKPSLAAPAEWPTPPSPLRPPEHHHFLPWDHRKRSVNHHVLRLSWRSLNHSNIAHTLIKGTVEGQRIKFEYDGNGWWRRHGGLELMYHAFNLNSRVQWRKNCAVFMFFLKFLFIN